MGRIPDEDIQRVRDATDVVQLVSESVVLKQKGRLYWGLCPFHGEKTPSFKVDPTTQLWHCFGCGEGGDVFGFLMRTEHVEFPDAVRVLADRANIEIRDEGAGVPRSHRERLHGACDEAARFFHRTLVSSAEEGPAVAREYLKRRGFGIEVAKRFELGYAPGRGALVAHLAGEGFTEAELVDANLAYPGDGGRPRDRFFERVMFPIRDISGRAIGFGGRIVGSGEPKYLNTSETAVFKKSRNLYGLDRAKNPIVVARHSIVVEGYTDVIALHMAGIENAVATLGTALTREHVKLLARFAPRIVYLFDADEAGLRAAERAVEFIDVAISPTGSTALELLVAVIPEGKDPADHVAAEGSAGMEAVIAEAVPLLRFVLDRRLDAHDLSTPEGRSHALADAASVLAAVKGSILAQDYANHLADRLLVDYATVATALERAKPRFTSTGDDSGAESGGQAAKAEADGEATAPVGPEERAQRALVGLLALHPRLRAQARGLLEDDLVCDPAARGLLETIIEAETEPGDRILSALQADDPAAARLLSGLLIEAPGNEEVDTEARDLVGRLKEFRLQRLIRQKKAHMNSLDAVKDRAEYDDLFREISALQVRLDETRRGSSGFAGDSGMWG